MEAWEGFRREMLEFLPWNSSAAELGKRDLKVACLGMLRVEHKVRSNLHEVSHAVHAAIDVESGLFDVERLRILVYFLYRVQ